MIQAMQTLSTFRLVCTWPCPSGRRSTGGRCGSQTSRSPLKTSGTNAAAAGLLRRAFQAGYDSIDPADFPVELIHRFDWSKWKEKQPPPSLVRPNRLTAQSSREEIVALKDFITDLVRSRKLIIDLAKRDYRQQNQGSYLGLLWNYMQPLL